MLNTIRNSNDEPSKPRKQYLTNYLIPMVGVGKVFNGAGIIFNDTRKFIHEYTVQGLRDYLGVRSDYSYFPTCA